VTFARDQLAGQLAGQDEQSASLQLGAKAPDELTVKVEGVGTLALPLTAASVRKLRSLAAPAQFGRGEETLVDPSVRDTAQVPTGLVRAEWPSFKKDLAVVREELGLPVGSHLRAELHSLLVYSKGQFFLPHQDSEKHDGMVATLVVTLPSKHTGGELVVHHLGELTTYRGFADRVAMVAFYSDCKHEVLPVRSGRRVTLTYNLILEGSRAEAGPGRADLADLIGALRDHFTLPSQRRYSYRPEKPPRRLVLMLRHEYSQRGLSWDHLKGADANEAAALREAAIAAGYDVALALTGIKETWDAFDVDDRWGPGSRGGDTVVDHDGDDYVLNDLLVSEIELTWLDGEVVSLPVDEAEVCAVVATIEIPPDDSDYEGYMGNYGNTLDRWYSRAAVVLPGPTRIGWTRVSGTRSWSPAPEPTPKTSSSRSRGCSKNMCSTPTTGAATSGPSSTCLRCAMPTRPSAALGSSCPM
jgi:predicted 2-oxoglutarate/Fe(II)-dependent dioxygenase YbiX/8-oxo-dGTP pyrophosphatase MutT (NUDIX family)